MKVLVQFEFDTESGQFSPSFGDDGEGQDVTAAPVAESHSINAHGACARGEVWGLVRGLAGVTADGATVVRITQPPAALGAFAGELAARAREAKAS